MTALELPTVKFERKEYLKRYVIACVRDSVLSWSDLANLDAVNKVFGILSRDMKAVIVELGREAGGNLLQMAGAALGGIAEDVVAGRRPR